MIFTSLQECYLVAQLLVELRGTISNRVKALITSLRFLSPQSLVRGILLRTVLLLYFNLEETKLVLRKEIKYNFLHQMEAILQSAILIVTNIFVPITFSSRLFSIRRQTNQTRWISAKIQQGNIYHWEFPILSQDLFSHLTFYLESSYI